jgi:hypothetical protein
MRKAGITGMVILGFPPSYFGIRKAGVSGKNLHSAS